MVSSCLPDPITWADETFGACQLGDPRRTARAAMLGAAMLARPAASLPQQHGTMARLKGAYHLLHSDAVTHAALLAPQFEQTRRAAAAHPLVLLLHDNTLLDYSHHPTTEGLGRIGNGRGRGFVVHSVLAVLPTPRQVLGLAAQATFVHGPKQAGETLRQRQARRRESDLWPEAAQAIGTPGAGTWVHVGDREADCFRFLTACRQAGCHVLVRAAKDRRVALADETIDTCLAAVKCLSAVDEQERLIPASATRPARQATLKLGFGAVTLQPPRQEPSGPPLPVWLIHAWEDPAPTEGEPIDWVLLSSLPVETPAQGWERIDWYRRRWTIEDYHQCLKTGCRIEQRQLGDQAALERLLAICAPVAVDLLRLRDLARADPDALAQQHLPADLVAVIAALAQVPVEQLTLQQVLHTVARRGGWLARRGDGPPGWKTLWRGWQEIHFLREGRALQPPPAPT